MLAKNLFPNPSPLEAPLTNPAIRGVGESIKPMIINIVGICLFRLVWLIFVVPLNLSIKFVVLSYPISWVATSLMLIIYYYKGNWLKKK